MPKPIEVYVVTPQQLFVAYLAWLAVTLLAVAVAVLVLWPRRGDSSQQSPAVESAETVELPRPSAGGPRTGTIHAGQYRRAHANEDTVVIVGAGERR